jgi:ATP-binding cassette subfamily C (CFTR/MRP) protein 4
MFMTTNRWLGVRLDLMSGAFVLVTSFASIAARDSVEAGVIGLSLAYALQLTGQFQWAVRQSTEVESQMVSVERTIEYAHLEPEETNQSLRREIAREKAEKSQSNIESAPSEVNSNWPTEGKFEFRNVSMQYSSDTPKALRGVSFTIDPQEKIGIVGRTGAGKSSLLYAIFRLSKYMEGDIYIDGVPTSTIDLQTLRSRISVIPQDPTLFSGSVRYNLDPFNEYRDADIWRALEDVQLKSVVEGMTGTLDANVEENGANFSVGQRQLICLARAALRSVRFVLFGSDSLSLSERTGSLCLTRRLPMSTTTPMR